MRYSPSFLLPPQNIKPIRPYKEPQYFLNDQLTRCAALETQLFNCMEILGYELQENRGFDFTDDDLNAFNTAGALIDALTKIHFESDNCTLKKGNPSFLIFRQEKDDTNWKLFFANATYLSDSGIGDLHHNVGRIESDIMKEIYTPGTIDQFNIAAQNHSGGYNAQYIKMDNNEKGIQPAYFWYRKAFPDMNGGFFEIRIGMNGTNLSEDQQSKLIKIYNLSEKLRETNNPILESPYISYSDSISRIRGEISTICNNTVHERSIAATSLHWMEAILRIANDIVRNSPIPLTMFNGKGELEKISVAYTTTVGYKVNEIIKPDFLKNLIMEHREEPFTEEDPFKLIRGDHFVSEEGENKIPGTIELIPSFYKAPDKSFVRINTAKPV